MNSLAFKPIDLEHHAYICIQFAEDTEICSFGSVDGFREEDGKGAERFIERIRAKLAHDPLSCIHVWRDDNIVGQIHLEQFIDSSIGYINFFYIAPAWRGKGVATRLDDYATAHFKQRGFKSARLSVTPANARAVRFYLNHGWKDLGPREDKPNVHNMENSFE